MTALGKDDDKVVQMLYDQIRDLTEKITALSSVVDNIKSADMDKMLMCTTTKSKFSNVLSRTTLFMESVQKQFDVFIMEISAMKEIVNSHDKALYILQKNLKAMVKDKEKAEKENEKVIDSLSKKDADLDQRVRKQEPWRYMLTAFIAVIAAIAAISSKFASIAETLEKWFK